MALVKVLKRKDASSVLVAIVLAGIVAEAVAAWSSHLANWLSGQTSVGSWSFKDNLWAPFVALVVQVVVLEVVVNIYVAVVGSMSTKK